jgi:serine/threonine protein kinase
MHIQLTDFGSSVIVENNEVSSQTDDNVATNGEKKVLERRNSLVGTAQFVAPEILQHGPVHYGFVRI